MRLFKKCLWHSWEYYSLIYDDKINSKMLKVYKSGFLNCKVCKDCGKVEGVRNA